MGAGDAIEPGEWSFDVRVGGRDVAEGKFHNGPVSRYVATYTDIVEHNRIVTTYDMWLDGVHMSTSIASLEFEPIDEGTRFTHVEHGVFFDQFWADGPNREKGTRGLLNALGSYLAERTSRDRAVLEHQSEPVSGPCRRTQAPVGNRSRRAHDRRRTPLHD